MSKGFAKLSLIVWFVVLGTFAGAGFMAYSFYSSNSGGGSINLPSNNEQINIENNESPIIKSSCHIDCMKGQDKNSEECIDWCVSQTEDKEDESNGLEVN